jgi:hypothetical protein
MAPLKLSALHIQLKLRSKIFIVRRKYTTTERAVWNKRFYQKKRKLGWITCSFLVPVGVSKKVQQLKRELMAEYKRAHTKAPNKR